MQETDDAMLWVEMFLIAVETQGSDAVSRAERIIELRERYQGLAATMRPANRMALVASCARARW